MPTDLAAVTSETFDRIVLARVFGLGQQQSSGRDVRQRIKLSMRALYRLVPDGGDLVVIDHFNHQNMEMAESVGAARTAAGFSKVTGMRSGDNEDWLLRFINQRQ